MAQMKVMTYEALELYDPKIKAYVETKVSEEGAQSLKTVALVGNVLKFYKVSEPVGTTEPVFQVTLPETDISGLLSKLNSATAGDVVIANADGTVADSGVKLSDLTTKAELEALEDGQVETNKSDIATLKTKVEALESGTYDDTELRGLVQDNTDAISDLTTTVDGKADKATTLEGYGITDAYTKNETDTAITTAVANAGHLKRSIVDVLPDVADANEHTIYMVAKISGSGSQQYDEYMLINGVFEKIGDSTVDLTDYATKEYADQAEADALSAAKTYADGLATNYDAAGAADSALADAKSYTDTQMANITAITEAEINALFS